jgi:hypothetical protein
MGWPEGSYGKGSCVYLPPRALTTVLCQGWVIFLMKDRGYIAMTTKTEGIITILAKELQRPREVIIEESLRALVERQLVQIKADILQIAGKHGISSVEEMERQYREGTLEEADSWQDFQRLDHLEYKRDLLTRLLQELE